VVISLLERHPELQRSGIVIVIERGEKP